MVCLIWGTPAVEKPNEGRDGHLVDSSRAGGEYFISGTAIRVIENCDDRTKVRLTSWLVEQRRLGNSCPEIFTTTISDAKQRRDLSITERVDGVLHYLESESELLGSPISYRIFVLIYDSTTPHEFDLVYLELLCHAGCIGLHDLEFLLHYMNQSELIVYEEFDLQNRVCTLTVKGYARLADLEKSHSHTSRAFVAMWFNESMNGAWEIGFRPAIVGAGYEPIRVDRTEHVNKIDDQIIAEIRKSRFVVADFTHGDEGVRGGVYYEAGFAHGLGMDVIFTCRHDVFGHIHFDTRQYNHIVWQEPEELRDRLLKRIEAVIGEGPVRNI